MKRIFLFLLTNIAVMATLTVVAHVVCALLGVENALGAEWTQLLTFAAV